MKKKVGKKKKKKKGRGDQTSVYLDIKIKINHDNHYLRRVPWPLSKKSSSLRQVLILLWKLTVCTRLKKRERDQTHK